MHLSKVKDFLDANAVKYVVISHSKAYTAQGIAAVSHISGKELAKTVIVKLDGALAMAVLPASYQVDLPALKRAAGVQEAALANPLVQRAQEIFKAEIRSVLDLREK